MKTLEFNIAKNSGRFAVFLLSLFLLQISASGDDGTNGEEESLSFTMRVCGTLGSSDAGTSEQPEFFIQNGQSDIMYAMKGDVSEKSFYLEGRFLPDSTHCHFKSVKTPDSIPLGEEHCWYTVYDQTNQQMILYMDSEDNCGDSGTVCEVDRISTKMGMKCGMMAQELLDADRAKAEKGLQADASSVAGSLLKLADRALTQAEIQADFEAISGK